MSERLRCLLIDDQPLVRLGIRRLLHTGYEIEEAPDGAAGLELVKEMADFDVAVVEMRPPRGDGLSGTATIRELLKLQPGLGIVAHGKRPDRHAVSEALDAGARCYVTKRNSAEHLPKAIRSAADSERFIDPAVGAGPKRGTRVTKRQRQILQLIADGASTATVARRLGLSTETVKTHTKQIFARLEARDRAHAVAIALRSSLIE